MNIVIYIYNGMTMLDAIGPYEVLRNLPNANIRLVAKKKGEITADSGVVHLHAKHQIDEVHQADLLLIPGSMIAFVREMKDRKVLEWIKSIDATTQKTVTVCTGSILLAATGLLKDKKATSHWKPIHLLSEFGAIPTRERIVEQGKFITAAGVSAGIDMALYLLREIEGEAAAKVAQLAIEYDPNPIYASGNYTTAAPEIIGAAERLMAAEAKKELSLWDMIKNLRTLKKLGR
ncbi:MAG: DJ-1/PfpI family protein [Salibacteraceae bacterium]